MKSFACICFVFGHAQYQLIVPMQFDPDVQLSD